MKRYFLLTSVLALAACGGGSGGGGGNVGDAINGRMPGNPTEHLRASDLIGNTDNNEITSMASAIVVKNGSSWSSVARSATDPDKTSHPGYTIYKLDNVDFKLAGQDDATFNFEINDDGRIVRAVANGQKIERDTTDTTLFKGKIFQFVKDGDDKEVVTVMDNDPEHPVNQAALSAALEAAVTAEKLTQDEANAGHWNYLEQNWKFDTSGKDKGLTYSDFGYFTSTNVKKLLDVYFDSNGVLQGDTHATDHESVMVFAGGYNILPEATRPANGAHFTGTAIGMINTSIDGIDGEKAALKKAAYEHSWQNQEDGVYNTSEMAKLSTKKAELDIDSNGNPIIWMPFGSDGTATDVRDGSNVQWYNVRVTDGDVEFVVPTGMTESNIEKRFSHDNDAADNPIQEVDDRYYGVNTPEEATGTVVYKQQHDLGDGNTTRDFNFQAAYGMK